MLRRHVTTGLIALPLMVWADDPNTRAEKALTELLFAEEADEFTSYRFVNTRGYLEIIFASNTPRDLARALMDKIRALPDVSGARERFVGAPCRRF